MREVTIRRVLVLALCTSGVIALWVTADHSGSGPQAADRPTPPPHRASQVGVPVGYPTTITPGPPPPAPPEPRPTTPATRTDLSAPARSSAVAPPAHRPRRDDRPPAAVTGVRVLANSHASVTVSWAAVRDRSGIAYYQATLNGIPAGETAGRQLTVDWFNDDMSAHFIQVRAVDGAGNRGPRSAALMITRPAAPSPTPTVRPTSGPTDRPEPTSTPPTTATAAPTTTAAPGDPAPTASTTPDHTEPPAGAPKSPGQVMQPSEEPSASAGTLERRDSGGGSAGR